MNIGIINTIKKELQNIEQIRNLWEKHWIQKDKVLKRKLETLSLLTEKDSIDRDLDKIINYVTEREKNIGKTHEEVEINLEDFQNICQKTTVLRLRFFQIFYKSINIFN